MRTRPGLSQVEQLYFRMFPNFNQAILLRKRGSGESKISRGESRSLPTKCWVPSQSRKRLVVEFYVGSVDSAFAPSVCKALNGATRFPQLTVVN